MDAKFRQKMRRRNRKYVRLLVAQPDFQKKVSALRKKWRIPVEGFQTGEAKPWHERLRQADDQFLSEGWPKVQAKASKLIAKGKHEEARDLFDSFARSGPGYDFEWAVLGLMREIGILPLWDRWTRGYILYNNASSNADPSNLLIARPFDYIKERDEVLLRIQKNTTLEDVEASWELITF